MEKVVNFFIHFSDGNNNKKDRPAVPSIDRGVEKKSFKGSLQKSPSFSDISTSAFSTDDEVDEILLPIREVQETPFLAAGYIWNIDNESLTI